MYGNKLFYVLLILSNLNTNTSKSIHVQDRTIRAGAWVAEGDNSILSGTPFENFLSVKFMKAKPKYVDIHCHAGRDPIVREIANTGNDVQSEVNNISYHMEQMSKRMATIESLVFVGDATQKMNQRSVFRYLQRFNRRLKVKLLKFGYKRVITIFVQMTIP